MADKSKTVAPENTVTNGDERLLDLFFICNVPTDSKFHLFCRFLEQTDVDVFEYFDEELAEQYYFPDGDQYCDYYHSKTHYSFSTIPMCAYVDGFKFGEYETYEDAVNAAKSYSAKELLDKFFSIYNEAKDSFDKTTVGC